MVSVVAVWLECGNNVPSHSETSSSLLSVSVLLANIRIQCDFCRTAESTNRSVSVTELTGCKVETVF